MAENIQEKIEDKVIDCINSGVAGRLIIFKPEERDFGADLAVERRGKYKDNKMYFQINSFTRHTGSDNFVKDFLQKDFKTNGNFYLVFVYFDDVRQKISDHVWLVPSLQFRNIADILKSDENENVFRFQAPLDVKNKNKYSKFVVETKQLGKIILEAFVNGGKFDFKATDFEEKNVINLESLKEFLSEARRNTYATNAMPIDNPRLLESIQLEFQKGNYFYQDIHFLGGKKFIGLEIVYQDSNPIWGMNYFGDAMGKLETDFLKESLFKLSEKCRMGQACEHEKREYRYQNNGQGNLDNFSGKEEISLEGKNIYKLNYQGGLVSK
jgi:hypothetical protein